MWPGICYKNISSPQNPLRASFNIQTDIHGNPKVQAKRVSYDLALQLTKWGLLILITAVRAK